MKIDTTLLRKIVEGALLAADGPLSVAKIASLFDLPEGMESDDCGDPQEKPSKDEVLAVLEDIQADCKGRGFELKEVGSGWRFQVVQETAPWINRLWEEKPQKYSRALLETLALIAYRQPITRGDIESIRGVAVSSTIIKTLTEREWVKVVGHRDVPGRPALYATTRQFLDYFNLKSLDELPSLKEIQDFDKLESELNFQAAASTEADASPEDTAKDADDSAEGQSPAPAEQTEDEVVQASAETAPAADGESEDELRSGSEEPEHPDESQSGSNYLEDQDEALPDLPEDSVERSDH